MFILRSARPVDTAYEAIQAEHIRKTFIGIIDNYGEGDSYDFDYTKAIVHDPKNDRDLLPFSCPTCTLFASGSWRLPSAALFIQTLESPMLM